MLALHEIAPGAGSVHADTETLEFRITDIEGRLSGFEGVDKTLGKAGIGHGFLPVFRRTAGTETGDSATGIKIYTEISTYIPIR